MVKHQVIAQIHYNPDRPNGKYYAEVNISSFSDFGRKIQEKNLEVILNSLGKSKARKKIICYIKSNILSPGEYMTFDLRSDSDYNVVFEYKSSHGLHKKGERFWTYFIGKEEFDKYYTQECKKELILIEKGVTVKQASLLAKKERKPPIFRTL